jgi:hypothetical protein
LFQSSNDFLETREILLGVKSTKKPKSSKSHNGIFLDQLAKGSRIYSLKIMHSLKTVKYEQTSASQLTVKRKNMIHSFA